MLESLSPYTASPMPRFLNPVALFVMLALQANSAVALGFDRVVGNATLGQPLNLSVPLRLESGETLGAECVKADVTVGERRLPSTLVRVRIESAGAGERRLRVTTSVAMDEPIVSIDLAAGCPARFSRQFVVFADPPTVAATASARSDTRFVEQAQTPLSAVPPSAASNPSASTAVAKARRAARQQTPGSPSSASTRAGAGAGALAGSSAGRASSPPTARAAAPARRKAEAPAARGPVLRLDPLEEEALSVPVLRMETELAALPAPPGPGASRPRFVDPDMEQLARDKERMASLEADLKRLQGVEHNQQEGLAELQARLRQADADRYANPLVYGLAVLSGLLVLGLLAVLWLRRRERNAAWWQAATDGATPADADAPAAPQAAPAPPVLHDEAPWGEHNAYVTPPVVEPPVWVDAPLPPVFATSVPFTDADLMAEPRRPMSAEELIDLEQQAEFFVVLGQDDAAIDLLMGHLRSTGGVSPVPYLKLLEIYRRRGEQDAYERIRERFNRRFNAYAPDWEVDAELGQPLTGYPEVMSRLQAAWSSPVFAMELLDAALFRRDNGPTFDVPAYRELLFLYSVARDLAERAIEIDGVDFLLPLESDTALASSRPALITDRPAEADEVLSLDLDVTLDEPSTIILQRPSGGKGAGPGPR